MIEGYTACESRFYNITRFFRRKSAARNPKEPDVITKLDPLAVPAGKRRRTPRARGRHAGNRTWHGCDDNALGCANRAVGLQKNVTFQSPTKVGSAAQAGTLPAQAIARAAQNFASRYRILSSIAHAHGYEFVSNAACDGGHKIVSSAFEWCDRAHSETVTIITVSSGGS